MLKPISNVATRIAEGRKRAARSMVLTHVSSVTCVAFRRGVKQVEADKSRDETMFPNGIVFSGDDQHAIDYDFQGYCMLLVDRFFGSTMTNMGDDVLSGDAMFMAQIEPFHIENYGDPNDMLNLNPDWQPKKGDIFAMIVGEKILKWVEVIGITGQTLHGNHGEKYALNIRDRLEHLEVFIQQEQILSPTAWRFPMLLKDMLYKEDAVIYQLINDPNTIKDDEIKTNYFKLVNIQDPQLANLPGVLGLVHLSGQSGGHYYFSNDDAQKINVNLVDQDHYALSSDTPVQAIPVLQHHLSYVLVLIDHPSLVPMIQAELKNLNKVQFWSGSKVIYDLMPLHYSEVLKAYHAILSINVGQQNHFELRLNNHVYELKINAEGMEVTP